MSEPNIVVVTIMDREFSVNCPPQKEAALREAAHYVDGNMRRIRRTGKVVGADRLAIMTALNLANELINNHIEATKPEEAPMDAALTDRLTHLHAKIDGALADVQTNRLSESEHETRQEVFETV